MNDLWSIVGPGPVLVLAPHPDDESLGCGALLATCWRRGTAAHVACLTDGAASHPGSRDWPAARLAELRRAELSRAVVILGGEPARDLTFLDFPDAGLHEVGAGLLARAIEGLLDRLRARALVVPSGHDPHSDHVAAFESARAVASHRPDLRLLCYPVWSRWAAAGAEPPSSPGWTRHFLHAPEVRDEKAGAIGAHASQRGGVVEDDPNGFAMPEGFATMFLDGPEIFDLWER